MKIFIDGKQAEVSQDTRVSVSISAETLYEPGKPAGEVLSGIKIPATLCNREIMGYCNEIHIACRFNDARHIIRIEEEGALLAEGIVQLLDCSSGAQDAAGYFKFNLVRETPEWTVPISIAELFPAYSAELSATAIEESWTAETPVSFLPVLRRKYDTGIGDAPSAEEFGLYDYHPFINIADVVGEVFSRAGYSLNSDFFGTPFFRSLYMSGAYREADVGPLKQKMNFRAGRFSEASTDANYLGRVFANPYSNYNTIGNIVDTADPEEIRDGMKVSGVFDNGGCFRAVDERMAFVPRSALRLGFRYKMKYVSGYRIKNGSELKGFDTFYMGNNQSASFKIPNRFADRKKEFYPRMDYRCIVPEHISGTWYRLDAKRITNLSADPGNLASEDYVNVTLGQFSSRSSTITASAKGTYVDLCLYCGPGSTVINNAYEGEWLLYDGYVSETGTTEIEVTFESAPHDISPGSPKYFDDHFWGGAEENMEFTLRECAVTPVFQVWPEPGTQFSFADIAEGIKSTDLISSLKHMFNLCFHTDEREKRVDVEPREDFLSGPVLDWSDRIDYSEPVILEETGAGQPRVITFRYAGGDCAVGNFNAVNDTEFGAWSSQEALNIFASDKEKVSKNPLFAPSVNSTGEFEWASSASFLNVEERKVDGGEYTLNFPLKIVSYLGMRQLPAGQRWSWPTNGIEYPLLGFHLPEDNLTLCFEDRDGLQGLHHSYDQRLNSQLNGRKLTLSLRLGPGDIEALLYPNALLRDMRARFKFTMGGEQGYWRLEEVCGYDPCAVSTKCVFLKVPV